MAGVRFDGFASCGPGRAKVKAAVTLRTACVSGKHETDDDKKEERVSVGQGNEEDGLVVRGRPRWE